MNTLTKKKTRRNAKNRYYKNVLAKADSLALIYGPSLGCGKCLCTQDVG